MQALDAWLRREKGVELTAASRDLILEALEACRFPDLSAAHPALRSLRRPSVEVRMNANDDAVEGIEVTDGASENGGSMEVPDLNERLWLACQLGDEEVVDSAIADGAQVNGADETGWSALHFAASANQIAVIQTLLMDKGADAEAQDNAGVTPLMVAAISGFTLATEQLLVVGESSANAHETTHGLTALHLAAANNHFDTAVVLYLHGGDMFAEDFYGRTPEMSARFKGHNETAEKLALLAHSDADMRASRREAQRQVLSEREREIARAAGFPCDGPVASCSLRSQGAAGFSLLQRLNPSKYHVGLPGMPRLDSIKATGPRMDPFICLPDDTVTKGKFEWLPEQPVNTTTGGPNGPLWSYNMPREFELEARALFKHYVEVEERPNCG